MSCNEPILTNIEATLRELIGTMTIANGYFFDWSLNSDNTQDMTLQSYPCAYIELSPEETCLDDVNGADANSYLQEVNFTIIAKVQIPCEDNNPNNAINPYLNKVLDDLKKVYGMRSNLQLLTDSGAFIILYKRSNRVIENAGDRFIPAYLNTQWILRYTQDRENPTLPGDI